MRRFVRRTARRRRAPMSWVSSNNSYGQMFPIAPSTLAEIQILSVQPDTTKLDVQRATLVRIVGEILLYNPNAANDVAADNCGLVGLGIMASPAHDVAGVLTMGSFDPLSVEDAGASWLWLHHTVVVPGISISGVPGAGSPNIAAGAPNAYNLLNPAVIQRVPVDIRVKRALRGDSAVSLWVNVQSFISKVGAVDSPVMVFPYLRMLVTRVA